MVMFAGFDDQSVLCDDFERFWGGSQEFSFLVLLMCEVESHPSLCVLSEKEISCLGSA